MPSRATASRSAWERQQRGLFRIAPGEEQCLRCVVEHMLLAQPSSQIGRLLACRSLRASGCLTDLAFRGGCRVKPSAAAGADGRVCGGGDGSGEWGRLGVGAVSGPEGGGLVAVELGEVVTHRD
jgi:hypothetical protein